MSCNPKPVKTLHDGEVTAIGVGRTVHYVMNGICLPATVVGWVHEDDEKAELLLDLAVLGVKDSVGHYLGHEVVAEAVPHNTDGAVSNTWHFPERA
jgi:hypothetical protein